MELLRGSSRKGKGKKEKNSEAEDKKEEDTKSSDNKLPSTSSVVNQAVKGLSREEVEARRRKAEAEKKEMEEMLKEEGVLVVEGEVVDAEGEKHLERLMVTRVVFSQHPSPLRFLRLRSWGRGHCIPDLDREPRP